MAASELEVAVERFNGALAHLREAADKAIASKPLNDEERAQVVARIDKAIDALRRALGEEAADAAG